LVGRVWALELSLEAKEAELQERRWVEGHELEEENLHSRLSFEDAELS